MKKFAILLLAAMILLSGCIDKKPVENGDKISVNYIGRLPDGKVFDTSIEKVAKENNIFNPGKTYKPLKITVGRGEVIKGFDDGVIGMKVGQTKTLTIPPEEGYGPVYPELMQAYPVIQVESSIYPRIVELPIERFNATYGENHKIEDIITIPGSTINLTVLNLTKNATLSYNFKVGDFIPLPGAPWNLTVVKVDAKNFTVNYSVKKNDVIQFQNVPWNTTVIDISNVNITLRHNPIPDTMIPGTFGPIKVSFNETSILLDQNHELAGKTLIFTVTVESIGK
jgi:FKBP-type peptidyl-prolyl cis-trans isomerase 2